MRFALLDHQGQVLAQSLPGALRDQLRKRIARQLSPFLGQRERALAAFDAAWAELEAEFKDLSRQIP